MKYLSELMKSLMGKYGCKIIFYLLPFLSSLFFLPIMSCDTHHIAMKRVLKYKKYTFNNKVNFIEKNSLAGAYRLD